MGFLLDIILELFGEALAKILGHKVMAWIIGVFLVLLIVWLYFDLFAA